MTKQEKLFRAIGFVGDDLITRADQPVEKRRSNVYWIKWAALAACCVLVIGLASRLPLWNMKSDSTPDTATMTMETAAAETPTADAPEETMEEAIAEEAPAEEDAKAGESGVGSRGETAANDSVDAALEQELLETTLGPVKLGMALEDVHSLLGEPKEKSDELSFSTGQGDRRYVTWRYNFTNDPNYISDVKLSFTDVGDGFVVDEIMTFGTSDWALPTGIRNGSSAEDVLAAYPDAQADYDESDGSLRYVELTAGHVRLSIRVENGSVQNITLGRYYEEPNWLEEPSEEPAYSFASADITMYRKDASGWRSQTFTDKNAKRIEVICGIEDLVPIDTLPEPAYYLDFQNGTVVMLGEDLISGAVYTCEDLDAFRAAMDKGEDPTPYLTLLEQAKFPYGTDDVIRELTAAE